MFEQQCLFSGSKYGSQRLAHGNIKEHLRFFLIYIRFTLHIHLFFYGKHFKKD